MTILSFKILKITKRLYIIEDNIILWKTMFMVGQVATPQEAYEIQFIVSVFVVAKRIKDLASEIKKWKKFIHGFG